MKCPMPMFSSLKTDILIVFFLLKKNNLGIYAAKEIRKLLKMKQFSTNKDKDFWVLVTIVNSA